MNRAYELLSAGCSGAESRQEGAGKVMGIEQTKRSLYSYRHSYVTRHASRDDTVRDYGATKMR